MTYLPPPMATTRHTDAASALAQVRRVYDNAVAHLRKAMQRYVAGDDLPGNVRACYPFVRVQTHPATTNCTRCCTWSSPG